MVQSVSIVQEDDTDYDQQWSRRISRAASFGDQALLKANPNNPGNESRASSSTSATSKDEEDDGIPVIFDADQDSL